MSIVFPPPKLPSWHVISSELCCRTLLSTVNIQTLVYIVFSCFSSHGYVGSFTNFHPEKQLLSNRDYNQNTRTNRRNLWPKPIFFFQDLTSDSCWHEKLQLMQRNKELMFLAEEDLSASGSRTKRSSWKIKNDLKCGLKRNVAKSPREWTRRESHQKVCQGVCVPMLFYMLAQKTLGLVLLMQRDNTVTDFAFDNYPGKNNTITRK